LQSILRNEWKFKGHVVTDCGALDDIFLRHKAIPTGTETAAAAIRAGVDLDCSSLLQRDVMKAIEQKLLTQKEVDNALAATLTTQVKLGFFDPPATNPFSRYGADSITNAYHINLARTAAQQSMVLLKNNANLLPLDKKKYGAIMVVGPNAASLDALVGNYHGVSSKAVNFVEGITNAVDAGTRIEYDLGCDYNDSVHFGGIWAAGNADITIAVMGLSPVYEGEEGDAFLAPGGGDRKSLGLPVSHIAYLKALRKANKKPIIAVITAGSAVDIATIEPYADAIILAWYPGEQGGNALADIIFGKVSPAGRLPVTFYNSLEDLPAYANYNAKGHSYRYYDGKVQYPFGYGLSYTSFNYEWATRPATTASLRDSLSFSIKISNTGNYDGDEIAQVYIKYPAAERMPIKELKAFKRVHITRAGAAVADFAIPVSELQKWDLQKHQWKLYNGNYSIIVGADSRDEKLAASFFVKGK